MFEGSAVVLFHLQAMWQNLFSREGDFAQDIGKQTCRESSVRTLQFLSLLQLMGEHLRGWDFILAHSLKKNNVPAGLFCCKRFVFPPRTLCHCDAVTQLRVNNCSPHSVWGSLWSPCQLKDAVVRRVCFDPAVCAATSSLIDQVSADRIARVSRPSRC